MMWTLVLLADFVLEFRLEYLWPCWLFFGSVYTTFHYHGLVRATRHLKLRNGGARAEVKPRVSLSLQVICVVFVCAAFTLDIFCLIFVPLHWLFFAASTYVLLNYIWHTGEPRRHRRVYAFICCGLSSSRLSFATFHSREGHLRIHGVPLDPPRVHRGLTSTQRT